MFELLGSESEHEEAAKRIINLQEEIIENYEGILICQEEIKNYEQQIQGLNNALKHWKEELVAEVTKEKKPKTK